MDNRGEISHSQSPSPPIERVQIGARVEKRLLKVLKGLAEYYDLTLGDLLEGLVLHAFESRCPFGEEGLRKIAQLKEVYGMDYGVEMSHRLTEETRQPGGEKSDTL